MAIWVETLAVGAFIRALAAIEALPALLPALLPTMWVRTAKVKVYVKVYLTNVCCYSAQLTVFSGIGVEPRNFGKAPTKR